MRIGTSPTLWLGNREGRYLARRVDNVVWWAGMHKDGSWASVFRGALFKNGMAGEWMQVWRADGGKPRNGTLILAFRITSEIEVVSQTGGFIDRRLKQWTMNNRAVLDVMAKSYGQALEGSGLLPPSLTAREGEVLKLLSEGMTVRDIGQRLSIGIKTVETFRQRIMDKLNIHTIAGLVVYAIKHGIITVDS